MIASELSESRRPKSHKTLEVGEVERTCGSVHIVSSRGRMSATSKDYIGEGKDPSCMDPLARD